AVIWAAAFGLIRLKYAAAERAASVSARELLDTYEAQVVRALREIDQTLNLVRYGHDRDQARARLSDLGEAGLLPPDLVFLVSIADANGVIVDSTGATSQRNVSDRDYFREQREADTFAVGQLARGATGEAKLAFSRRLNARD